MGKKFRPASLLLKNEGDHYLKDGISMLPNEILVFILSLLSLKEAAVTSVLSRRWRHLWSFITPLDFDATEALVKIQRTSDKDLHEMERHKYVSWVNQVVRQYKGPSVEEFRVSFELDKSSKSDIDSWLMFALAMSVRSLVLDLSRNANREGTYPHMYCYTFPCEMLSQVQGTSLKISSLNSSIMRRCSSFGFQYLKALCLKCVNVSGDVIECFLSNCPDLERLCVHCSAELVRLKVSGPSLVLKHLEINYCHNIKSLEISNVNIASLIYKGHKIRFLLKNVPMLIELSIGGLVSEYLNKFYPLLSSCLSRLETLILRTSDHKVTKDFNLSPKLTSLKKLILYSYAWGDKCLLGYTSLIKASPKLQKFVLQVEWLRPKIKEREVIKAVKGYHEHLEEVELSGYYGRQSDLEFFMYFLESAVALKKIVIDPHDQFDSTPKNAYKIKQEKAARARAKQQLEDKVPAGIELMIL